MGHLVVIIGAGASHDCATRTVITDPRWRPPLVNGLFGGDRMFLEVLNGYPRAEAAAADIRRFAGSPSFVIENHLRDVLMQSAHLHDRQQYREIPCYLQDLLFTISSGAYAIHADNYDTLLNAVLRLDDVTFVSLNYDTLLDDRLRARDPINTMSDYINEVRRWSLIKLHGSVDWGRALNVPTDYSVNFLRANPALYLDMIAHVGDRLDAHLSGDIELRHQAPSMVPNPDPRARLGAIRVESESRIFYPAVSVPVGSEDELSCPPDHQAFLREKLQAQERINLLVIGYSGYDQEVLRFLTECERPPGRVMIVNPEHDRAMALLDNLWKAMHGGGDGVPGDAVFTDEDAFSTFVAEGALAEFVERLA